MCDQYYVGNFGKFWWFNVFCYLVVKYFVGFIVMYVWVWQQGIVEVGCLCFRQFVYCIYIVNVNVDDIGCFKVLIFCCVYVVQYGVVVYIDDQLMFNFWMLNQY